MSGSGAGSGSAPGPMAGVDSRNYDRNMLTRFSTDYERRRQQENPSTNLSTPRHETSPLKVEVAEFYPRDNAKQHHTDQFELVVDTPPTPILRRGLPFFFAVRFDRHFDVNADVVRLQFGFGPKPAVPKGTRIILPVGDKKVLTDNKDMWDVKVHHQDGNTVTFQVKAKVP